MAAVADAKTIGAPFGNAVEVVKVVYDGAVDGLVQADLDLLTAEDDVLIKVVGYKTIDALTSGGSAVLDVGIGAGGTEFGSNIAFAGFSAGAFVGAATEGYKKLASGSKLVLGIEAADLTAGSLEVICHVMKF
jgi:hypothetical protein